MKFIPLKSITNNPKILFVGINPHPGSYKRKIPFSNNKKFWYLLNEAGIINYDKKSLKDDRFLSKVFHSFKLLNLSFINLVDRPTVSTNYLNQKEIELGRRRLLRIIKKINPLIICFIGKITYRCFSGKSKFSYGWNGYIFNSKVYVMHFPIRGPSEIRIKELKEINKYLKKEEV
ncbi:MAG: uracil-DNA glycosylase family protein [Candidatus Rehaiarchaeum fermentans]|nr:hypothetical protein [Candidatus Rehaiarchaeum fermentans]MCW1302415.1 hypothetical protein [Candidatus Rehaiarchaeum fermentans]